MIPMLNRLRFLTSHPLYHDRPTEAIKRFIKWQVASRCMNEKVAIPYVNNSRIFAQRGLHASTSTYYVGLKEFDDMGFVLHFLRKEDLFIDVGANVGVYTILAAAGIGSSVKAFEPFPGTFRHLVDNINLNDCRDRAELHNICIGDHNGESELELDPGSSSCHHIRDEGSKGQANSIRVQMRTIDSLSIDSPACLKIDVEGFEHSVIQGAIQTLRDPMLRVVLMETNSLAGRKLGRDPLALHRQMLSYGFEPYRYDPRSRQLTSLDGKASENQNTLYLREIDFIKYRIDSASPFHIHGRAI